MFLDNLTVIAQIATQATDLTTTNEAARSNYFLTDLSAPLDSTMQHMLLPILYSLSTKARGHQDDLGPVVTSKPKEHKVGALVAVQHTCCLVRILVDTTLLD
jgi:hypothetical protein